MIVRHATIELNLKEDFTTSGEKEDFELETKEDVLDEVWDYYLENIEEILDELKIIKIWYEEI